MTDKFEPNSPPHPTKASVPVWLVSVRALLLVAIAGAAYLAWVAVHHGPVAGCGPESSCDKVLHSHWAYWLEVPVSVPALLVYLALFGATIFLQKRPAPDDERGSWAAIITLSVIVAGAALWFVGLQVFVIKAFCKFCMTAHACGFTAALLCLKHIPMAEDATTPMWTSGSEKRGVPSSAFTLLAAIGLAGVALLAGGQVLMPKKLNVVTDLRPKTKKGPEGSKVNSDRKGTNAPALEPQYPQPPRPGSRLVAPRLLSLYSNAFLLKLDTLPMIGSPDASNVIVCLFDYTCPHCRSLHSILVETQRRYSNQLGIVCLPMPISSNCNPFLPPRVHSVSNSCEYARLGLAVWRAAPAVHGQFDAWIFTGNRPAPLEQAQAYAAQLVGGDKLQTALGDPWLKEQILVGCRLHSTNWSAIGSAAIPQLVIGDVISAGPLLSSQQLVLLLQEYLGLTPPDGSGL